MDPPPGAPTGITDAPGTVLGTNEDPAEGRAEGTALEAPEGTAEDTALEAPTEFAPGAETDAGAPPEPVPPGGVSSGVF